MSKLRILEGKNCVDSPPNRSSSAKQVNWVNLFVFFLLFASTSASVGAQPLRLSKHDISGLYGSWRTVFGNGGTETIMRIHARTIAVGERCSVQYAILGVRVIEDNNVKFYVVEIKESKVAELGAPIKGMSRCFSDGLPFVAWRLPVFSPDGGLPPLEMWNCASDDDLRKVDSYSINEVTEHSRQHAHPHSACGNSTWFAVANNWRVGE